MYLMPNYVYPLRYENGILGTTSIGRWWNPIYSLNYQGSATQKTSRLFSDVTLKQNLDFITKGLSVQAKVSYNTTFAYNRLIQKDVACMYWERVLTLYGFLMMNGWRNLLYMVVRH